MTVPIGLTVSLGSTGKVMAFDNAGKALTLGCTSYIQPVAGLELEHQI